MLIKPFYYLVYCPNFQKKKVCQCFRWYHIWITVYFMFSSCFVHKSFLVTKKKMLEAVCIGEQDVVFSVCSFSGFFVCYCYLFINDTTRLSNPVHGFRPFFVSCYWRTIHLIYVIFLHFVIYKQYCFFLSPVQCCDHFVVVNFVKFW